MCQTGKNTQTSGKTTSNSFFTPICARLFLSYKVLVHFLKLTALQPVQVDVYIT